MPGLQLHLKKHARDAGHTPSVKEMLRSPLPAIPPFKGSQAQLPEDAETTIPAVRMASSNVHYQFVLSADQRKKCRLGGCATLPRSKLHHGSSAR